LFKRIFRVVSIVVLIVSSLYVHELFILLISADIYELVGDYSQDWKLLPVFAIIPALLFLDTAIIFEYALISLLTLLVYMSACKSTKTIRTLAKSNEDLRDRIEDLAGKLNTGGEYEAHLRYLSQIEERNSIAQSIHDKVGHTLAGSIIQLEAAQIIIDKDSLKATKLVGNVTENLKTGMESIRSTLRAIKPAPEQLGVSRLKLVLEEFSLNNEIKTSFSYEGKLDAITHMQWRIMTDNLKEALTNAMKYSEATLVEVRLEVMHKLIKMEVKDNGKGAAAINKGMGLSGMDERTGSVGGKLIVDGSGGFSVIMLLPVESVSNGSPKGATDERD
jgi:signal transduction histidine kinase